MDFENVTTHTITNHYSIYFPSEGQGMMLWDAAFAFITNGIDEAIDFNPNAPALVSARLCSGTEYSFLDDANYLMVADNGKGINFDEFFQNGHPGEMKQNHHYHKGVVRALSCLDPNGNGRIVVVTKGKSGWTRYDGDFFGGEVIEENSDLGLSEKFNSYIFARIDESKNHLSDLKDMEERLSKKYHFYLKNESLSLTWNGTVLKPLIFIEDPKDEHRVWREDFGSFALEIELFRIRVTKEEIDAEEDGEDLEQPIQHRYPAFVRSGGVAIYHNGLLIQDAGFQCLFNWDDAKEFYSQINAIAHEKSISEKEAVMSDGVAIADELWGDIDASYLPENGMELHPVLAHPLGVMGFRYRYLVNVIPQNGFELDTDNTSKTRFLWEKAFKQLLLAIDSVVGKEYRDDIRQLKATSLWCLFRDALEYKQILDDSSSSELYTFDKVSDNPASKLSLLTAANGAGQSIPISIMDFKADELTENDADDLMRYHRRFVNDHKNELPVKNGMIQAPDLQIHFYGTIVSEEILSTLHDYKKEFPNSVQFRVLIIKKVFDEDDDEFMDETIEI